MYQTKKFKKKIKITMQQGFQIVSTYVFVGQNNEKVEMENKVIMLWNVIQCRIQFTYICFCKIAFDHLYMQLNYKTPVIRFPISPFHILLSQFEKYKYWYLSTTDTYIFRNSRWTHMHSVLLVCYSYTWVYSQSIQNDHIIITYRHSMLIFMYLLSLWSFTWYDVIGNHYLD